MDRYREMEILVRVVETGSFSAAARHFGIGQPGISKAVAALEERLGVRLLVRSTRRLAPTEAGVAFYERAIRALAEVEEADAAAQGLGKGLKGKLRVCAPVTFARIHLVPHLDRFLKAHPELRLELIMDDRTIDLVAESIDVALRLGDLGDSAGTARRLGESERIVMASPDYLARRGIPRAPADLPGHDAVVYAQTVGGEVWRFRRNGSETPVRIQSRLTLTAAEGVRAAVVAGLGLTISSRWMFAPEIESGAVRQILEAWTLPPMSLWAVYPSGKLSSAKARGFIRWFEECMGFRPAALG
ncbi:MAG: LysR family transcriptional regulator [Bryobacteraceae bacterium]